ncbi:hypothetical protein BDY24DRAFT_377696 [Mrakia frigida]|uniref:uncharacterized protein n=1 Tax=Mrakia frigida TaxID=29902 RepID=UPI003FCC01C1
MSGNPDDFSFSGGLPYDEAESRSTAAPSKPFNPDLDFALDDIAPPRRGGGRDGEYREYRQEDRRERREPQERTANLYLLSEIKPVVRRQKMASDLLEEDYSVDEVDVPAYPVPVDDPSIRTNALYFQGTPFTELPTGKIFTYISSFSASVPLGIEWIADDCLVVVFPSQKSASIALASLLVDPEPSSASTTGQLVPLSLWPKEYKQPKPAGELRMEVDEGEGAAGDSPEVMQGVIEVRWAKVDDKKGYSKGTASNFYRKNGHQAGKPQASFDDHPSSSSRPGRATNTSSWAHDLHDDISSPSSSFNSRGLPSRPSYPRDPEVPFQEIGVDLLAPSFSLERPSHYRGDDNDEDDAARRGHSIRGRSRRSASPPNLAAPSESSTRRAASLLKRFAGRSRSRSPPGSKLSERIAKIPLDERLGIKLSASGDLLGEDDLPGGGGMRIDEREAVDEVDLMAAIGGGKGAGMMIDRPYVQQGAIPRRQGSSSFGRSGERGVYEGERGVGGGRESFASRQQEDRGGRRNDRDWERRGGERRDDRGGRDDRRDDRGGGRREARAEDLDSELEEFLKKR